MRGTRAVDDAYTHLLGIIPAYAGNTCVAAYEARRRGFDVVAKPRLMSNDELPYMKNKNGWPNIFKNPKLEKCTSSTGIGTKAKVETLMKSYGEGARAIVRVQWKGSRGGHVFIAEQINGKTVFIDPQDGTLDCSNYFKAVKKNATICMRVDNLVFTKLLEKAVEEA